MDCEQSQLKSALDEMLETKLASLLAFDNFFSLLSSEHGYSTTLASKSCNLLLIRLKIITVNLIYTSLVLLFGIIWIKT